MIKSHTAPMRIVRCFVALTAVSALSACGGLGVFQADRNFDNRIYAGGGVLLSRLEPDTSEVAGVSVDDSDSGGGALMLGYDLNNRFTVEGHVADLGESTLSPEGTLSYQVAGLSALVYGLNNRDKRLNREGLAAFGRLGLGAMNNEAESVRFQRVNDVHLLIGAGLEYGFANGLAARAELVGHDTDAKYAQLALIYRFGGDRRRRPEPPAVPQTSAPEANVEAPVEPPQEEAEIKSVPVPQAAVIEPVAVDADLDGVMDDVDACLNTSAGLPVDATGCEVFQGAIEGVNFVSGSSDLTEGARDVLTDVAQTLRDYPAVKLTIQAHTDNSGDATANLQLSRRRALAVARFLVEQGILGSRLRPQAFGESQPRVTNATTEGRAANRRVEFSVSQ